MRRQGEAGSPRSESRPAPGRSGLARTLARRLALVGGLACELGLASGPARELGSASALAQNPNESADVAAAISTPTFDPAELPAAGRQRAILTVPEFGRYSITATSAEGTAIEAVDRMAGSLASDGAAGERDGRLDLFLDRGEVAVVTRGTALARGVARLSARPFVERQPTPTLLVERRRVDSELGDLEQRSWWLDLAERRVVAIEAAGRHLADLALWQNGEWRIDATTVATAIAGRTGEPLRRVTITADLAPGLYRLSAYGGTEIGWTSASTERPLVVAWGLARRGTAGREAATIGPLGSERFLVPGAATYFRLELPASGAAAIEVVPLDAADPLGHEGSGDRRAIVKETNPPAVELRRAATAESLVITISGTPGQAFTWQHFDERRRTELSGKGRYWLGSVRAGAATDEIDATGVLYAPGGKSALLARDVVAADRGWARRFNLLETTTLFFSVETPGRFALSASGTAARFRVQPLWSSPPAGYQPPATRSAPAVWELDPGVYVLELEPVEAGVVEVRFGPESVLDRAGSAPPVEPSAATADLVRSTAHAAVRLGEVELAGGKSYVLLVNDSGPASGPIVRKLPLDLDDPLPLALAPGDEVELSVRAREPGRFTAELENGGRAEVALAGGAFADEVLAPAGEHRLRVRHRGESPALASVLFIRERELARAPEPALSAERLASFGAPAVLSLAAPQAFDLGARAARTFRLAADAPALYRVESTGLLALEGALRTRVAPTLVAAAENGAGRNVALASYLREGDYQVTLRARGLSAGHAAVRLERAPVADGGRLAFGLPARATLAAGGAIAFRFTIEARGEYRLRALGEGGLYPTRLEDLDGWPIGGPLLSGDARLELEPGEYRWIVLPRPLAARAVALVEPATTLVNVRGHGPHPLPLDTEVEARWMEPEGGESAAGGDPPRREPDRFRLVLAAATELTISAGEEMEGELSAIAPDGSRSARGAIAPRRGFRGELAAGEYEIALVGARPNNRLAYRIRAVSTDLLPGMRRELVAPAVVGVALGAAGDAEIASFGAHDVRARLYDSENRLVAANDDRPDDWNFLLARRLVEGRYRLAIDPVGASQATTEIAFRVAPVAVEPAWSLGERRTLALEARAHVVPLAAIAAGAELLAIAAHADGNIALVLERRAAARDAASRETAARDAASRETAARDAASSETAARDAASGETAAREAASGETAAADVLSWETVASRDGERPWIGLPLPAGDTAAYRLRVRSLDRRPTEVRLTGFAGRAARLSESALGGGSPIARLANLDPPLAVVAVDVARPGCFAVGGPADLWVARRAGEAFERESPGENGDRVAIAGGAALWLASESPKATVRGRRLALDDKSADQALDHKSADQALDDKSADQALDEKPADDGLAISLDPGERVRCDLAPATTYRLLEARALAGQPMIAPVVGDPGATAPRLERVDRWVAVAPRVARGLADAATRAVEIWNAGSRPIDVRAWARALSPSGSEDPFALSDGKGHRELELFAGDQKTLSLAGEATVRITLEPGLVARFEKGGVARATVAAFDRSVATWLHVDADRLVLANATAERLAATLQSHPANLLPAEIEPGTRLEARLFAAGVAALRLASAPAADERAESGWISASPATFVGADGSVGSADASGRFAAPAAGGTFWLASDTGVVDLVPEAPAAASGGAAERRGLRDYGFHGSPAVETRGDQIAQPLSGTERTLEFETAESAVLSLRTTAPAAVALLEGEVVTRFAAADEALAVDWPLRPGVHRIALRGLAGASLSGRLDLRHLAPLPYSGTYREPQLMAPGEALARRLELDRSTTVGFGVQGPRTDAALELFDSEGRSLERGFVFWRRLEPGSYTAILSLPRGGEPSRVGLSVVGLEAPPTGPPPEVVRQFAELERGADPAAAAGAAAFLGSESPWRALPGSGDPESYEDESYDEEPYAGDDGEVE